MFSIGSFIIDEIANLAAPKAAPNSPLFGFSNSILRVLDIVCSQNCETLPPPIAKREFGDAFVFLIAYRQSLSAKETPSITHWVNFARLEVCPKPENPARI